MFWWARVVVVRGLGGLWCAGEEGGADTAVLPSLETLSCSPPAFTARETRGVRPLRGVTELTILLDSNNLLLLDTELQDKESRVIPGGGDRQRHYRQSQHSHGDCAGLLTKLDYSRLSCKHNQSEIFHEKTKYFL